MQILTPHEGDLLSVSEKIKELLMSYYMYIVLLRKFLKLAYLVINPPRYNCSAKEVYGARGFISSIEEYHRRGGHLLMRNDEIGYCLVP